MHIYEIWKASGHRRTGAAAQLHIEDPIDIGENLNFAAGQNATG